MAATSNKKASVKKAAAAPKQTVKVEFKGGVDAFSVSLDGSKMTFSGDKASRDVAPGTHFLQWFVLAREGTEYTVAITAPITFDSGKLKVNSSGKSAGMKRFKF